MKNLVQVSAVLIFCFFTLAVSAQTEGRDFKSVDAHAKSLGRLDSMNMGTISSLLTKPFKEKIDKARAIYTWIAHNIVYDVKAARSGQTQKNTPTEVLIYRKAVGIGFASLFQDMCSAANIRCLTADGFIKTTTEAINENDNEINHSWAVVQLGLSPETWFYVDPAMGSGEINADVKTFTPSFNHGYFFPEKNIFNWQHYPDNSAWLLGAGKKNKKDFDALPVIGTGAYEFGLVSFLPAAGKLKIKTGKAHPFKFTLTNNTGINSIALISGDRKKRKSTPVKFNISSGVLSFEHIFTVDGSYPLTVMVNGKELISYAADIEE